MDLQQIFYLLGTIVFGVAIIVFVVALVLTVSLYLRYKKFMEESKQKVTQFKRRMSALPFLPIVGFFIRNLIKKRRSN